MNSSFKWFLRSYNLLVNERGDALKLVRGTWRNPEHVIVLPSQKVDDENKQQILSQGMKHVFVHITDLERALLTRLEAKKRASRHTLSQLTMMPVTGCSVH